jgi:hypothetical protein
MEKLIIIFGLLFFAHFCWQKVKAFFRKKPKSKISAEIPRNSDPARDKAISTLMTNLQKAKSNRPEIIEENPKLAAQVLKHWAKDDKKKT